MKLSKKTLRNYGQIKTGKSNKIYAFLSLVVRKLCQKTLIDKLYRK